MWAKLRIGQAGHVNPTGRNVVSSPNGTQAVDRAARLLTEVVHAPGSVTFTELAAATGLAKSTTSRLLLALERNGLVRRDEAGRFRPGEMFVRFAWRGGAEPVQVGLGDLGQPGLGAAAPGEPDEHLSGAELARLVPPDEPVALEREQQP